jgi:hypothetical protein
MVIGGALAGMFALVFDLASMPLRWFFGEVLYSVLNAVLP